MIQLQIPQRFPLDNAAQIFVNIVSKGETTLSRIGLVMSEPVDRERLQQAITNIIPVRFPYFQVYLKKTFFAYVLERTDDIPQVEDDSFYTNRHVDFHDENFLYRFRTGGNNIALEMSHILSDGYGTLVLLLSVTAEYFRLEGIEIEDFPLIFTPGDSIDPREWGCAYAEVFSSEGPSMKAEKQAYIPEGKAIPFERYYTAQFQMDLEKTRKSARERKVTLVVLISGIYLWAIQQIYLEDLKAGKAKAGLPLRFQIPINLRRDYPTRSLKNFSYIFSPSFTLKRPEDEKDLEEIIRIISEDIRYERHNHTVENQVRRNLRLTENPLYKYMPRVIKERFLAFFYQIFARGLFSGVLTSLGEMKLPPALEKRVEAIDILACNSPAPGRNSTMFSYKGILEVNIGSTVDNLRLEEKIAGKLNELELEFKLQNKRASPDDIPLGD
ncbi:MAG: hypothetical protein DRP70_11370 [Spirochaetes bacterium]|nr:MAG: hypothetical protein DRP70_11370 [Spirochaetota bacterium]